MLLGRATIPDSRVPGLLLLLLFFFSLFFPLTLKVVQFGKQILENTEKHIEEPGVTSPSLSRLWYLCPSTSPVPLQARQRDVWVPSPPPRCARPVPSVRISLETLGASHSWQTQLFSSPARTSLPFLFFSHHLLLGNSSDSDIYQWDRKGWLQSDSRGDETHVGLGLEA